MQVIESLDSISRLDKETVLTFGAFDGVHIGHRAIIEEVVNLARKLGLVGVVLSFDPHPMSFLSPTESPPILTTKAKKIELLKEMGVDI
ncbi:MAG: adenylyltransferase/cytidyltransferase family protein, partial [Candidatus Poribacteria bacterium]